MVTGFKIFTSNRLEVLADELAGVLQTPLASPLAAEVIVVQSRGMARWLSMEIARRRGICANVRFPFPKAFVEEAFTALAGPPPRETAFSPETMTWKIMRLLPLFLEKPGFGQIKHYLKDESSPSVSGADGRATAVQVAVGPSSLGRAGLKRYQLAVRIASLFDQYLIFRPEMMAAWEQGKTQRVDEQWQCALWRELAAGAEGLHPAARKEAFIREIRLVPDLSGKLPERIAVFGVSVLPRFHLEVFHALAQRIEVNLFLMNPSREFWGDIRSDREREQTVSRVQEAAGSVYTAESLYLERGNRLLASLGALGREFYSLICEFPGEEGDFFREPAADNLLSFVQDDILNLRDRGTEDRKVIAPGDRSIQFHSCHSPLREIEALYDNLLALFEADKELLPRDILVMAPDIEVYAPLIKAVFDRPPGPQGADLAARIPFTVADRGKGAESPLIEGFVRFLELAGGRCGATEVLSLLELPEISAKFAITPSEVELIRRWVRETGVRWGIDGESRRRLGLPPRRENTWQEGLDRLLMGYALSGKDGRLAAEILPYDLEGSETEVLGRLVEFAETLFPLITALPQHRTLGEWSLFLEGALDRLLVPLDDIRGWTDLRAALVRLRELEEESGFRERVELAVVKAGLERTLTAEGFGYGFLAGGVTFCSLLPMRSIPFPVICLLGMNGTDYPRRSWAPAFDLLARHPRPGDRSRRKDDRYLFLEALLSARHRLIISYVGQDSADNSLLPPSLLVTELLDYLEEGFALPAGGSLREQLVTVHRLQAFSPAYFAEPALSPSKGKGKLFTYSEDNWRAARCLTAGKTRTPEAVPLLPLPEEDWRSPDINSLVSFLADPVDFLFRRRLEARFEGAGVLPEDREPFKFEGLEKYDLEKTLVEKGLAGRDLREYGEVARASGRLPHGAVGDYYYGALSGAVQGFVARVQPFLAGNVSSCLDLDLRVNDFRLTGRLPLYDGGLVHFRPAVLKIKDHLRLWIAQLAMRLASGRGAVGPAILLGRGEAWRYQAPAGGEEILAALLEIYWAGLQKPLPFFPLSSWKYGCEVFGSGKSPAEGLQSALRLWRGDDERPGEGAHPYYRLCFRDREPLDEEFQELAARVLAPLFAAREKI